MTESDITTKTSAKENQSTSDEKHRLLQETDVYVKFLENNISYTTIGSDGLSTCTFILVVGNVHDHPFAYLSHYPEFYDQSQHTPTSTLVCLINKISRNIGKLIQQPSPNHQNPPTITDLTNLQVFTGGGAEEDPDLVRDAFTLLNNDDHNIQHHLSGPSSAHIYQQLKSKAKILKSTTCFASDDDDSRERLIQQAPGGLWHNMSIKNLQRYTDLSKQKTSKSDDLRTLIMNDGDI